MGRVISWQGWEFDKSSNTTVSSKTNEGSHSATLSTNAARTQPVSRTKGADSNIKSFASGTTIAASSGLDLSTEYAKPSGSFTLVLAYASASLPAPAYIIKGSGGEYIRVNSSTELEFKGSGTKAVATTITLSTALSSTFEVLVINIAASGGVRVYNHLGNLIANPGTVTGSAAAWRILEIFHAAYRNSFVATILDLRMYAGETFSTSQLQGMGKKYKLALKP